MRRLPLRRPSPALIVSLIAVFLALGGTTYALTLPTASVGTAQLRPNAVTYSRIAPLAISASKFRTGSVVFSKLADNQFTSQKIKNGSLLGEDLAPHTITGAQVNVSTLNITRFAQISATGTVAAQSGGISVSSTGARTILDFGSSVAGRPITATLLTGVVAAGGEIAAAPCGGPSTSNPGGIVCPGSANSPNFVAVDTFDSGGTATQKAFYVTVPQA
jgi:hypothetical protein